MAPASRQTRPRGRSLRVRGSSRNHRLPPPARPSRSSRLPRAKSPHPSSHLSVHVHQHLHPTREVARPNPSRGRKKRAPTARLVAHIPARGNWNLKKHPKRHRGGGENQSKADRAPGLWVRSFHLIEHQQLKRLARHLHSLLVRYRFSSLLNRDQRHLLGGYKLSNRAGVSKRSIARGSRSAFPEIPWQQYDARSHCRGKRRNFSGKCKRRQRTIHREVRGGSDGKVSGQVPSGRRRSHNLNRSRNRPRGHKANWLPHLVGYRGRTRK